MAVVRPAGHPWAGAAAPGPVRRQAPESTAGARQADGFRARAHRQGRTPAMGRAATPTGPASITGIGMMGGATGDASSSAASRTTTPTTAMDRVRTTTSKPWLPAAATGGTATMRARAITTTDANLLGGAARYAAPPNLFEIGRASCRERVQVTVVSVALDKEMKRVRCT